MGERDLGRVEHAERFVVAEVVPAGHEFHTRRRAQRLGIGVIEPYAGRRQFVEYRSFVGRASVTAKAFVTEVVGHDKHDVGATT